MPEFLILNDIEDKISRLAYAYIESVFSPPF